MPYIATVLTAHHGHLTKNRRKVPRSLTQQSNVLGLDKISSVEWSSLHVVNLTLWLKTLVEEIEVVISIVCVFDKTCYIFKKNLNYVATYTIII